jgi:hypothetical protein
MGNSRYTGIHLVRVGAGGLGNKYSGPKERWKYLEEMLLQGRLMELVPYLNLGLQTTQHRLK